jgi:hypothetical protein
VTLVREERQEHFRDLLHVEERQRQSVF